MESRPRNRFGFFLRKYNFFLLLVFFWGFVYLLLIGNNSLLSRLTLQSKIARTTEDIGRLNRENLGLKNEIDKIKNDRDHMEYFARKLGYIRKNEVVYKFENDGTTGPKQALRKTSVFESFVRLNLRFIVLGLAIISFAAVWMGLRMRERVKRKGFDSLPK
jgi:cell division protein FtsB